MQKFSYHTHTNTLGVFDGSFSAEEMIKQAEAIGYTELGISNHMIYHPLVDPFHTQFFNNAAKFEDTMLKAMDILREAADKANIKVYVGFEADFFPSAHWRDTFEKLREKLNADYYIGASHFIRDDNEQKLCSFYSPEIEKVSDEFILEGAKNYWKTLCQAVESGYFDFMAHIDVYKLFERFQNLEDTEYRLELIETLAKHNMPYELNTSGWARCGEQHPNIWMLNELNKRNVPIVISDDAHLTRTLGRDYDKAEELLSSINYKNRWKLTK